jgi:ubiquitin carboxyl-terminal hydrolase 3
VFVDDVFAVACICTRLYRGYQQQDAHEFMRVLLDRLHSELLLLLPYPAGEDAPYVLNRGRRSTIVSAIFGGILQNEVHCLACGFQSKKHDPFLGTMFARILPFFRFKVIRG